MSKSSPKVLLIILGLVIFAVGGGLGIMYQTQKDAPQIKELTIILKNITSKVVRNITAHGEVSKIEGNNITLSNTGETLTILLNENSLIYPILKIDDAKDNTPSGSLVQKLSGIEDIKVGNIITINFRIMPDGSFEGRTVMILPQFSGAPASQK